MIRSQPILLQTKWKAPPREKVHEALSAVVDDRVDLVADGKADVWSSDRSKRYTVTWSDDKTAFGSNDNASFYQGYIGYPIIAALLKLGVLAYQTEQAAVLKDVPWKAVNKKHKNNYSAAVNEVLNDRLADESRRAAFEAYVDEIFGTLSSLELSRQRPVGRPPS